MVKACHGYTTVELTFGAAQTQAKTSVFITNPPLIHSHCSCSTPIPTFMLFSSAGGTDDTPMDLVKWKAILRSIRACIDLGVLSLRLVLWVKYNALSSVFLIKNLYNLLHTAAQIERYMGVRAYPKYTLFTESVSPADWYGMSKTEWRQATQSTITLQAQSGRAV